LRPTSFGTAVATVRPSGWQPEQAAAPAGMSCALAAETRVVVASTKAAIKKCAGPVVPAHAGNLALVLKNEEARRKSEFGDLGSPLARGRRRRGISSLHKTLMSVASKQN